MFGVAILYKIAICHVPFDCVITFTFLKNLLQNANLALIRKKFFPYKYEKKKRKVMKMTFNKTNGCNSLP